MNSFFTKIPVFSAFIGSHAVKLVALLTVPFCGTVLYYNNDQSVLLDSVQNNMEEDIIMENDILDKDQDHKIDQDFLDLIVKNYRHMKRVEIVIYIMMDGLKHHFISEATYTWAEYITPERHRYSLTR